MPLQSTSTSTETDILLNKTNIALARSQRIVSSWLPPAESTTNDTRKSDAEIQKEEDEIFTAVPERLGLGAPLPNPESNMSRSTEQATDDKLKKQLLGRNYKRVLKDMERDRSSANTPVSANSTAPVTRGGGGGDGGDVREVDEEEDDDDEDGRTSLIGNKNRNKNHNQTEMKPTSVKKGKKKRKGNTHTHTDMDPDSESKLPGSDQAQPNPGDINGDGDGNDDDEPESKSKPAPAKRKKATSFLDQVLGERAKKRKR